MSHTQLDRQAFILAGFDETEIANKAPREIPRCCPLHDARHPVTTWNLSGFCDDHYQPPSLHKGEPGAGLILIGAA
jgi:hypothetical protein